MDVRIQTVLSSDEDVTGVIQDILTFGVCTFKYTVHYDAQMHFDVTFTTSIARLQTQRHAQKTTKLTASMYI